MTLHRFVLPIMSTLVLAGVGCGSEVESNGSGGSGGSGGAGPGSGGETSTHGAGGEGGGEPEILTTCPGGSSGDPYGDAEAIEGLACEAGLDCGFTGPCDICESRCEDGVMQPAVCQNAGPAC